MFGLPAVQWSDTSRSGGGLWLGEVVATFGLLSVILGVVRSGRLGAVPVAVGAYIGAAYWFTSSTSFANPAVTVARSLTDTFTGIEPGSVPGFVLVQLTGGLIAVLLALFLDPSLSRSADRIVLRRTPSNRNAKERLMSDPPDVAAADGAIPAVLFLCVHNAGRSQMALGWFNHLAAGRAVAFSGGSEPAAEVNPAAVAVMAEAGIDIAGERPKRWTEDMVRTADAVVTMGCGDTCPFFPGKRYLDWQLDDPHGQGIEAVRPIRDEIEGRVRTLLDDLGVPAGS